MQLTIKHGMRQATRTFTTAPTVADLKHDSSLRAELGYGDNIRVLVNGVEQSDLSTVPGPVVSVETLANQKA